MVSAALDPIWPRVLTHGQVTDARLVTAARCHGGVLATPDVALSRLFANLVELLPVQA